MASFSDGGLAARVKSDFAGIWTPAAHARLESAADQRDTFRNLHKLAVCVSALANAVSPLPEHKRVFLQEAASDAVHMVHVLLSGDVRGARFYLRSIIENLWRHQYFSEHRIEYGWLTSRTKYKVTALNLREYMSALECFTGTVMVCRDGLEREYISLSTEVHSSSIRTLVLRQKLDDIKLTTAQCKAFGKQATSVLKDVIVLITVGWPEVFESIHVHTQAFVLACLDATRRRRRQDALTP
jgi:hypothetical protein